ncbi:MAG: hypothetical protein F4X83_10330 [Chloroflexi bacterium]|nr:hypothetical protein [Chloroflexota bacterium]
MYIIDTVVLLYFMLTRREQLLLRLLGSPLRVPLVVYDPEEEELPVPALQRAELLSEMRQAIRHYEIRARTSPADKVRFERLRTIDDLHRKGMLETVPLVEDELQLAAELQSREAVSRFTVRTPLGAGEASCVSIAFRRGWTIATDDNDALTVLSELHGSEDFAYHRIRSLLIRAGNEGLVTRDEANRIHEDMRAEGFWDAGTPFA